MTIRPAAILAILLPALLAERPALALSGGPEPDDSPSGYQAEPPDEPPPADYRYSGNGFNFSMSRNAAQPDDRDHPRDAQSDRTPPRPARPGFFQRMIRSLFGD